MKPAALQYVTFHNRTFQYPGFNLKVVSTPELANTPDPNVVALLSDGAIIARPQVPSLIDVLYDGADTKVWFPVEWGPGNTGVDGTYWDFECEPTKIELLLGQDIVDACALRRGDAPALKLPYPLAPVRGNPYRSHGVLCNTRFGDISYLTPSDTNEPVHFISCIHPFGMIVHDGKSVVSTTAPPGLELYIPTIPQTVLDYLDSRDDMPTYYTKHGTETAALSDLAKYDLSTQGFVLPTVFSIVRRYIIKVAGGSPPLYLPSNIPSKDSHAGINGLRFSTKSLQALPNLDALVRQALLDRWQTTTMCSLKKQYCSKKKTRTILGTSAFIALGHRAALSGVTASMMLAGHGSPICLGKNKFRDLEVAVKGRVLSADLASCDRSTPAIVRWFVTNLLYECAGCPEYLPSYVLNCAHDLVCTNSAAFTKRGGLSSGDPVTAVANTIYSLIIYTQHMLLSAIRIGHPLSTQAFEAHFELERMFEVQPLLVYSDDLVLYSESASFPNYNWWNDHLSLLLGFQVDHNKTTISNEAEFLGCRIIGKTLVPQRVRILAALGYHMKAKNSNEYYASAAAILMDACACVEHDFDWFSDLVSGIAKCANTDGYTFPGVPFFKHIWERLRTNPELHFEGQVSRCGICNATAAYTSSCGLTLCILHAYKHDHCPVPFICGHYAGSAMCSDCSHPVVTGTTALDQLLTEVPYVPPSSVILDVVGGFTKVDPGRYNVRKHGTVAVKRTGLGNEVNLPDGDYSATRVLPTCRGIYLIEIKHNITLSQLIIGPPGSGKTRWLLNVVKPQDVVYVPTHKAMLDLAQKMPQAIFTSPVSFRGGR